MCFRNEKSRLGTHIDFKFTVNLTFQPNSVVAAKGSFSSNQIYPGSSCPEIEKDNMERIASSHTSSDFCLKAELSIR